MTISLLITGLIFVSSGAATSPSRQPLTRGDSPAAPGCPDAKRGLPYYVRWTSHWRRLAWESAWVAQYGKPRVCSWVRQLADRWRERARGARDFYVMMVTADPVTAITQVFKEYAGQALDVAWCESRLHTTSQNGQYLGLFQMGSFARRAFGHGGTAWVQAQAAWRYFTASGRDWSPWSCKPS